MALDVEIEAQRRKRSREDLEKVDGGRVHKNWVKGKNALSLSQQTYIVNRIPKVEGNLK